jgi:hypothetical protein
MLFINFIEGAIICIHTGYKLFINSMEGGILYQTLTLYKVCMPKFMESGPI